MNVIKSVFIIVIFNIFIGVFAANINFTAQSFTAGKASLTEHGYIFSHILGRANFSAELKFPIQLVYNSNSEKSGLVGFAWVIPQLESSAYYDKDGVLWQTPWSEKIKFFPKKDDNDKNAIEVELYEEAKKGRGFFAPYSEWEITSIPAKHEQSGDWTIVGKKEKKGWKFVYHDAKIRSITAPSGRSIVFNYNKKKLVSIVQNNKKFVEIAYNNHGYIQLMKINGIEYKFNYANTELTILPKTLQGNISKISKNMLQSIQTAHLIPVEFGYDDYGFLNKIKQDLFCENLEIQHQSLAERRQELRAKKDSKEKYPQKINGRLLSDILFKYSYPNHKVGIITLQDKMNRKASYNYNMDTGVFHLTEFSGKSFSIYYFMRYDVAYLGKVRKIVDGKKRDVANYRYDKLSGNIIRARDMFGNDINFLYNNKGNLTLISKRAADQEKAKSIRSFQYDQAGNMISSSVLDEHGNIYNTVSMQYDMNNQLIRSSNEQNTLSINYNTFGYPETIENSFKQNVKYNYDDFNRLVKVVDIFGVVTQYTYTPVGLISKIERKDGDKILTYLLVEYDQLGLPIAYVDQNGKKKSFERDAFGRVIKEFFPDNTSVEYNYNAMGQLSTVTDQNQHKIQFDWDKFGLSDKKTPAGQLTDYVHDKYGLLTQINSKWHNDTDRTIKYEYDEFDRIIKITYGDNEIETRSYDSWSKLLTASRGEFKLSIKYDFFDRVIEKEENSIITKYTYNKWGQRTSRTIIKDGVKNQEIRMYDKFGRLTKIIEGNKQVDFIYNKQNQLSKQIVNGTPIYFEYDKYGKLQKKSMGLPHVNTSTQVK